MAMPTGAAPTLSDFQASWAGVTLALPNYGIVPPIEGLGHPELRTDDVPRPLDQGELMGQDFINGRDVLITLDILRAAIPAFNAVTVSQSVAVEFPFWVKMPIIAAPVGVMARMRKRPTNVDQAYAVGSLARVPFLLHSTDPRLYQATVTTSLAWGAGVSITNSGTMESRPQVTLHGPLTTPSITNVTLSGAPFLSFQTLVGGDVLVVDLLTHAITLNGTAQPSAKLSTGNAWWWLTTGANNISWTSSDGSQPAGSSASITYSPAAYASAV